MLSWVVTISRCKPFSNFLQGLAETVSLYPNLQLCHLLGRANMLADTLTRNLENATLDCNDTNLSEKQAQAIEPVTKVKPGAIIGHKKLMELLQSTPPAEFFDTGEQTYANVQKYILVCITLLTKISQVRLNTF